MSRASLLVSILLLATCVPARADFIGQSVHVVFDGPNLGSVAEDLGTQTIAAGGTGFTDAYGDQITVSGTTIQISFLQGFNPEVFNGFVISEVGPTPDTITGVSLGTTDIGGFDPSRLTFDGTDVFVNLQDILASGSLTVDVAFDTTAAPEPASLTLLGIGGAALGVWRRKRAA